MASSIPSVPGPPEYGSEPAVQDAAPPPGANPSSDLQGQGAVTETDVETLMSALFTSKQTVEQLHKQITDQIRKCLSRTDKTIGGCVDKILECVVSAAGHADEVILATEATAKAYCTQKISAADELTGSVFDTLDKAGYTPADIMGGRTTPSQPQPIEDAMSRLARSPAGFSPVSSPVTGGASPAFQPCQPPAQAVTLVGPGKGQTSLIVPYNTLTGYHTPYGSYVLSADFYNGTQCVFSLCVPQNSATTIKDVQAAFPGSNVAGPYSDDQFIAEQGSPMALPILACDSGTGGPPTICPPCPPTICPPCPPTICPPCPTPPPCPVSPKDRYNLWRRCKPKQGQQDCYCSVYTASADDPGDQWLGQFDTDADCQAAAAAACKACDPAAKRSVCEGGDFKWMLCDEAQVDMDDFYNQIGYVLPPILNQQTPTKVTADLIDSMVGAQVNIGSPGPDPYS